MSGYFGSGSGDALRSLAALLYGTPTRPKVFVSYHHGGDQAYYDAFTRTFHDQYEAIRDESLERAINSDDDDYTRWRIRSEFIKGTSATIVLSGAQTPQRKYVDWEIKATLDMQHGLIGIALPTCQLDLNGKCIVPSRYLDNYSSGYAVWGHWRGLTVEALKTWLADACGRSKALIVNDRNLKARNG